MSLFRWMFAAKQAKSSPESSGLSRMESTRPVRRDGKEAPPADNAQPANRKSQRMARRELLYTVVRESMIRSGVLSSRYKFKVLSLDGRGRQFLVMIDLAGDCGIGAGQFGEIEALIAQSAKARHDIVVTSVYWRTNEHVAIGDPRPAPAAVADIPTAATAPKVPPATRSAHDPIQPDEVAAFRQALAAGVANPAAVAAAAVGVRPAAPARQAPSSYTLLTGFEDTEMVDDDHDDPRAPLLSGTQYGDLS